MPILNSFDGCVCVFAVVVVLTCLSVFVVVVLLFHFEYFANLLRSRKEAKEGEQAHCENEGEGRGQD
jgi:hypothetical protein